MRTHHTAPGTLRNALCDLNGKEIKEEVMHTYIQPAS